MNIYIELLLLWAVVVFIVDGSGWTDFVLKTASRFTARYGYGPVKQLRPFTCSLCMTWWCGLAWCLIRGQLSLPTVAFTAGLAYFSNTLCALCIFLRETLLVWISEITELCTRTHRA